MSENGFERLANELRTCKKEELLQVLGTVDVEILLEVVSNEIKRFKQLEENGKRIFSV